MVGTKSVLSLVGLAAASSIVASAHATVLTFDYGGGNNSQILQAYGDRVSPANPMPGFNYGTDGGTTPNVVVDYIPVMRLSDDPLLRYGDLDKVLYHTAGGNNTLEIILTADPGYLVCLHYFDLAARVNFTSNPPQVENLPAKSIKVFGGTATTPLFQLLHPGDSSTIGGQAPAGTPGAAGTIVPGTIPLTHNRYNWDANPLQADIIRIVIDLNQIASKVERFGIDNIKFSQRLIPTPGSAMLLGGAALLAARRRRR